MTCAELHQLADELAIAAYERGLHGRDVEQWVEQQLEAALAHEDLRNGSSSTGNETPAAAGER